MLGTILGIAWVATGVSLVADDATTTGDVIALAFGFAITASLLGVIFARTMGFAALLSQLIGPIGLVVGLADGRVGPAFASLLFVVLGAAAQQFILRVSPFVLRAPRVDQAWFERRMLGHLDSLQADLSARDVPSSSAADPSGGRWCRSCREVVHTDGRWCPTCSAHLR